MENQIKDALTRLLGAIKAADGKTIASEMVCLDDFLENERASLHPQLTHFLERRSYAKALQFLGGDSEIPAGSCGGRH